MLVLTRSEDERVVIGDGDRAVVVTVVRVGRGSVRLAISAPRDVPVVRAEKRPEGTAGYCDDRR